MTHKTLPLILRSAPVDLLDGDCACAAEPGTALGDMPPLTTGCWQVAPGLYRAALPGDHELVSPPLGPSSVVVLNPTARQVLDAFALPQDIHAVARRFDLPHDAFAQSVQDLITLQLLAPAGHVPALPADDTSQTLTAWLHVTNACNLDCTYCYIPKSQDRMDEAVGLAAVDSVFRTAEAHGFQRVLLKYAGGEPSMNFALVLALHAHAKALAERSALELQEVMISNGISLTGKMLDMLRESGIRLVISLDSLDAPHDQRIFTNGAPSSRVAARGVKRAIDHGLLPHLSITVSDYTADYLAEIVTFALEHGLPFNLNFVRGSDQAFSEVGKARLIAGLRAAFDVIRRELPQQSLFGNLIDRAHFGHPHAHACGAARNYMVIDHHGQMARCQMHMDAVTTTVHAPDPLHQIRMAQPHAFENPAVEDKPDCRTCNWRYWCAGGCPLLAFQVTGRSDARSPYCDVYRAVFPDVLRLEALRLLKWQEAEV